MSNDKACIVCGLDALHSTSDFGDLCKQHYNRYRSKGDPRVRTIRDPNGIILYDDYAEVVLYNKESVEIARTKVSLDKLPIVEQHKWTLYNRDRSSYAITWSREKSTEKMHNLIFDVPEGMVVDHINRDSLDNRNENVRFCTQKDNSRNVGPKKNNKSGVAGVYWNPANNKWRARIKVDGKAIEIGSFCDLEEARTARKAAELHYYGEFGPQSLT